MTLAYMNSILCLNSDPHLTALTARQCRDHNDAGSHELLGSYKLPGGRSETQTFMRGCTDGSLNLFMCVAAGSIAEPTAVQIGTSDAAQIGSPGPQA